MNHIDAGLATYDDDYMLWLESQIHMLRERRLGELDFDKLIEELEGFVRNHRRELRSRLQVLIMHLLKWQYQPERRSESWRTTLSTQRYALELLLEDCPSLNNQVSAYAKEEYARALRWATRETGLPRSTFPDELPFSPQQLLDPDFVP